jgi:hypothetical protein
VRVLNRALAVVVAMTLLAGGVLVAVEIAVAAADRRPWVLPHDQWYRWARDTPWDAWAARGILLAVAGAGLVLLALQLVRRRPDELAADGGAPGVDLVVARPSLERSLGRTVAGVDGVRSGRVRISRRGATVAVGTDRSDPGDLADRVREAVAERLRRLRLRAPVSVHVEVRPRGKR